MSELMKQAVKVAVAGVNKGLGGPFGAIVVNKEGQILGSGSNEVLKTNDPTAHAEITAIRRACEKIGSFNLSGCKLYTSCYPCPMCLGAALWSRLEKVYYGNTPADAANAGFDDAAFYEILKRDRDSITLGIFSK